MVAPRLAAAFAAFLVFVPLGALAAPQPQALPAVLERPNWAIGFHWTYHYEGSTDQSFAGFQATWISDTYTSEIVAEASTAYGDAWVARNTHNGSMTGTGPGGFPATGTFTSLTFYYFRKADLAVINFTQDFDGTATMPIIGTVTGKAHNESVASPPLAEIAWGTPANGAPWHVLTNITSTGWVEVGSFGRVNTSGFLLLDFALAVNSTRTATVPAGTYETYNITGGGTANDNGTVYNFTEDFLLGPGAQNKVIDEAGYQLMSLYVNRPPAPTQPLPVVRVDAGASNNSVNLSAYFADPEGDPFTLSCTPVAGVTCSVAPDGVLSVTAFAGVNATVTVSLRADDGLPGGNATYPLTVLVRGPGNPNQPPSLVGSSTLTTPEDVPFTFVYADHFSDPDDAALTYDVALGVGMAYLSRSATSFTVFTPPNFNGPLEFSVYAFDSAGNDLRISFALVVLPVNDPPVLISEMIGRFFAHSASHSMVVTSDASDVDGDTVTVTWDIDGVSAGAGEDTSLSLANISAGNHVVTATARDPNGGTAAITFDLTVFGGPSIAAQSPAGNLHIASGSSVTFAVNASDPDSPSLDYRWTLDGSVVSQSINRTQLVHQFPSAGNFTVTVTVSDNGSSAQASWSVLVESAPAGLVALLKPFTGSAFDVNATVAFESSIDPRLSNLVVEWRLNGAPLSTAPGGSVRLSSPDTYVFELSVTGLYNNTVPYSTTLNSTVTVRAPAVNNTPNNTGPNNPRPPPELVEITMLLFLLLLAVLAAVAAIYMAARRRRSPPIA